MIGDPRMKAFSNRHHFMHRNEDYSTVRTGDDDVAPETPLIHDLYSDDPMFGMSQLAHMAL